LAQGFVTTGLIARIVLKHIQQAHSTAPKIVNPLTERELSTLSLMVQGYSNGQIADKLGCSVATVKTHVRSILHKLGASDRTEAAVLAMRAKLIR
jgi:DNA-binding NarL/FixJ family response regulator